MRIALIILALLAAAPAMAQDKITVLLDWFINPDHGPLIIAEENGYFAERGLEVEIVPPADPSLPPRLVAAGQADAEKLRADAKAEAAKILADAKREADAYQKKARSDSDSYRAAGEEALNTATRDAVLTMKAGLTDRFREDVARLVTKARHLNLDHLRPKIGQHRGAKWA